MKAPRLTSHWTIPLALALLLISMILPSVAAADAPSTSPEQTVQRAWQRAADLGKYRLSSEVVRTTYPAPAVVNVGRSPQQQTVHLEGEVDLPGHAMTLKLWQGGGSVARPDTALELRIEGDRAWGRQPGGAWQEISDLSDSFAPGNDFMAYLAGVKNVREAGSTKLEARSWKLDRAASIQLPRLLRRQSSIQPPASSSILMAPPLPAIRATNWRAICASGVSCRST
jgi:hypothetical protein